MSITEQQHQFAKTITCPADHAVEVRTDALGTGLQVRHGDHKMELRMYDRLPGPEIRAFIERCHAYDEDADER